MVAQVNATATRRNPKSQSVGLSCLRRLSFAIRTGMKSLREQLWFEVPNRRGFVNITSTVADLVRKSAVQEGLCLVNAMHITVSVFINDAEEGLLHDYEV